MSVVYENGRTIAFMDIQPVVRGHMLVVPRAHTAYLADLNPGDGARMFRIRQLAAAALRTSTLRCDGVNFFLADGEPPAKRSSVHLHVFPRFAGDGFGLRFPPDYSVRPRPDLDQAAAALRETWPSTEA